MTLNRPKRKVQRVHITARDPDTGKSKTTTIYGTSPARVITEIEKRLASETESKSGGERHGSAGVVAKVGAASSSQPWSS